LWKTMRQRVTMKRLAMTTHLAITQGLATAQHHRLTPDALTPPFCRPSITQSIS